MNKDKSTKIIYIILFLLFISLLVIFSVIKNYTPRNKFPPLINDALPPIKHDITTQGNCGIQSCHGLDITCGYNAPDVCDASYQLGDMCRQYVSCTETENGCEIVKLSEFDSCKSCVQQCLNDAKGSNVFDSNCEDKCRPTQPNLPD